MSAWSSAVGLFDLGGRSRASKVVGMPVLLVVFYAKSCGAAHGPDPTDIPFDLTSAEVYVGSVIQPCVESQPCRDRGALEIFHGEAHNPLAMARFDGRTAASLDLHRVRTEIGRAHV